jgi:cytochrome c553
MGCAGTAWLGVVAWLGGAASPLAAEVSEKLAACLACHGEQGQSQIENVPSIGAQPTNYALIQLFMFREKMRVVEPMNEAAKGLTDDDIRVLSEAVATLPPPKPPADQGDPARFERARALTDQYHCNICHRPDFSGQQSVPRLADQRQDYLLKTLREYKAGTRRAYEPVMIEALQQVPEAQLAELAYYLSHMR